MSVCVSVCGITVEKIIAVTLRKGLKKKQKTVSVSHCVITKRGYNNGVDHSV